MKTIFSTKALMFGCVIAVTSSMIHAKITIVSDSNPKVVGPIEIPNPTRLKPSKANNKLFDRRKDSLTEIGLRPLKKTFSPKINLRDEPLINLILNIVPKELPVYVSNDIKYKTSSSWQSDKDESWISQIERLSKFNNLSTTIDWQNQLVQISKQESMLIKKSSEQTVVDDNGDQYIIRKVEDDLQNMMDSGYLIQNGTPTNLGEIPTE